MNDASYFYDEMQGEQARFTIQWNGGRCILEREGERAEQLIRAVFMKSSEEIRSILIEEIGRRA